MTQLPLTLPIHQREKDPKVQIKLLYSLLEAGKEHRPYTLLKRK